MRTRPVALVVAVVAALVAVSGAPATAAPLPAAVPAADYPEALAPYYTQTLAWTPCSGMQCAWLTVPLDYADPSGATIRIRVTKSTATGAASGRLGSLVVNPGGPGASGLDFARYIAEVVAPKVARQYDIVGFDPRGVGKSEPVTCMTGEQTTQFLRTDPSPRTAAQERRTMAIAARIGRGCLAMSPTIAQHVGSLDTARDLDVLRSTLGDHTLNWLGFSYGTYLGTLYAELFPANVGRFVLDGALDPSLDSMGISQGQSRGFQVALTRFAQDCAGRSSCAWNSRTAALRGINTILARLDVRSMPTKRGPRLVQNEAVTAIFYAMYTPLLWPSLRLALRQAKANDGTGLQTLADYANDKTGPNSYGSNMSSAFFAISCWDQPAPPGADGLRAAARAWSRNAPVPELARAMSWGNAPCSTWYGHSPQAPAPASTTTTAPILVVGTIYDPATPYPWAVALHNQLPTSTLLTYRGDGHTAFGSGSTCIDNAITAYLLTGQQPAAGTVCR